MAAKRHPKQRILGFLGTGLVTFMQNQMWRGAIKAAQEHGAHLVFYPAIGLGSFPPFNPNTKILLDFIDARYIDGLLIWYAGIAEGLGTVSEERFLAHSDALPIVTVGGQPKNHPNLSIDNYQGVRAAVDHLIEVHGRQHIGIIRGPVSHPDADERYRGYVEALQAHGLPVNPDHVAQALFALQTGAKMTEAAITRWLQNPNQKLDAIVTGSDYMALAAVKAIEAHGLCVPDDIAVVGFDDVDDARANIPSITTVRQPFHAMGYQAIEMLLALTDGQSLPQQSIIPAPLVVRESCGCTTKSVVLANAPLENKPELIVGKLNPLSKDHLGGLADIGQGLDIPISHIENLARILQSDLDAGTSQTFLATLRQYLIEAVQSHIDVPAWQDAISVLRMYALSISNGDIGLSGETLLNQARALVAEVSQRVFIQKQIDTRWQNDILHGISEAFITSFGRQLLIDTLHEQLPALGFPGFYLSLYDDPTQPAAWSHLILAHNNNQRYDLPPEGLRFPTSRLLPESMQTSQQNPSIVVEPLYFGEQQLGILVLEVGPIDGAIYESLRAQISSALQGSQLLEEVQHYTAQLEQRVDERTAELTQVVDQLQIEVNERQQAQEALAQERNLLRTLVDSMPDRIFAKDTEGRFILKNEADVRSMGANSVGEVIGKTDFDYYPRELAERFQLDDQQVIRSGKPLINQEEPGVDKEGNERWILTTKVPLCDSQGQVIGLVGMGRDITERKWVEEEIKHYRDNLEELVEQRTAELKAANEQLLVLTRLKDEFVSNVSHELRTPISSIKLRQHLVRSHPEQAGEHLDVIKRETDRLARTIEDLLQLSRLDQQRADFHPTSVDLNELVGQQVADRIPIANDKSVTLSFQAETEIPYIMADIGLLGQVLGILLTNAINYTPADGQVLVKTHFRQNSEERRVGFSVSDTGPGIPPEEQPQLFARFFRGTTGHQSGVPGTGLGLAIAEEIVKRHDGTIAVESDGVLGHGTTFRVWIPVRGVSQ